MGNAMLLRKFNATARQLWVTKQLNKPMQEIYDFAGTGKKGLRYRLYSAHDTNVANIIK